MSSNGKPKCPAGTQWDVHLEKCVPECPAGYVFSPFDNRCVKAPEPAQCSPSETWDDILGCIPLCPGGHYDPNVKRCIPACPEGWSFDLIKNRCVPPGQHIPKQPSGYPHPHEHTMTHCHQCCCNYCDCCNFCSCYSCRSCSRGCYGYY
jgi:hypothetical protein